MTRPGRAAAKPLSRQPPGSSPGESVLGSAPLKNSQHEKLAREYAAGASKAEAWRAIGRNPSVGNQSRTFRRTDICARVEFLRGEFCRQAGISLAALQARLLRIADANVVAFFEVRGGRLRLRDLTEMSSAVTAPISELNVAADGAVKLKIADRLHAIDSLLKTIGGFSEKPDDSRGMTLEDLVIKSMQSEGTTKVAFQVITGVPRSPDRPYDEPPAESAAVVENDTIGG
jgi:hypothetical protein